MQSPAPDRLGAGLFLCPILNRSRNQPWLTSRTPTRSDGFKGLGLNAFRHQAGQPTGRDCWAFKLSAEWRGAMRRFSDRPRTAAFALALAILAAVPGFIAGAAH